MNLQDIIERAKANHQQVTMVKRLPNGRFESKRLYSEPMAMGGISRETLERLERDSQRQMEMLQNMSPQAGFGRGLEAASQHSLHNLALLGSGLASSLLGGGPGYGFHSALACSMTHCPYCGR